MVIMTQIRRRNQARLLQLQLFRNRREHPLAPDMERKIRYSFESCGGRLLVFVSSSRRIWRLVHCGHLLEIQVRRGDAGALCQIVGLATLQFSTSWKDARKRTRIRKRNESSGKLTMRSAKGVKPATQPTERLMLMLR